MFFIIAVPVKNNTMSFLGKKEQTGGILVNIDKEKTVRIFHYPDLDIIKYIYAHYN